MAAQHQGLDPCVPVSHEPANAGARHQPAARARTKAKEAERLGRPPPQFGSRRAQERGDLPNLTPEAILAWANAHHARTGRWPAHREGPVPEAPGETWLTVEAALYFGLRGLVGRRTLLGFLVEHWVRSTRQPADFIIGQILTWADAYYGRTGRRPISTSGHIPGTDGVTWKSVDDASASGSDGSSRWSFAVPPLDCDARASSVQRTSSR